MLLFIWLTKAKSAWNIEIFHIFIWKIKISKYCGFSYFYLYKSKSTLIIAVSHIPKKSNSVVFHNSIWKRQNLPKTLHVFFILLYANMKITMKCYSFTNFYIKSWNLHEILLLYIFLHKNVRSPHKILMLFIFLYKKTKST